MMFSERVIRFCSSFNFSKLQVSLVGHNSIPWATWPFFHLSVKCMVSILLIAKKRYEEEGAETSFLGVGLQMLKKILRSF